MKVVDTATLKKLVTHARQHDFNRLLDENIENQLDIMGHHVLSQSIVHGDV